MIRTEHLAGSTMVKAVRTHLVLAEIDHSPQAQIEPEGAALEAIKGLLMGIVKGLGPRSVETRLPPDPRAEIEIDIKRGETLDRDMTLGTREARAGSGLLDPPHLVLANISEAGSEVGKGQTEALLLVLGTGAGAWGSATTGTAGSLRGEGLDPAEQSHDHSEEGHQVMREGA